MSDAVAALYEQVYANPDDDHVRHVLADALIAQGDPRGELIQHQLQPDVDFGRRAMRLVQQHGLTWLGALRDVVVPLAYERGFLARCLITAESIADHADCVEWSTVHTIDVGECRDLVLAPAMRSLRRLVNIEPNLLLALANKQSPVLARVEVAVTYAGLFETMLSRYLPANALGGLTLAHVPADRVDRLRNAAAARHPEMKLELLVLGRR